VYLGDLERLQDIQRKRDITNRDWQRIILRNIAKSLTDDETTGWTNADKGAVGAVLTETTSKDSSFKQPVFETRQLWWQLHVKMQQPEYQNMLLLARMKDHLEQLLFARRQRYLTMAGYESIINKMHLDAEGHVVEPFVALAERGNRDERQKEWYEQLALDMEDECLIK
jgi:hypothetical protein